ncbi:MAG: transposase [Ignavibacteriaceae bacterium]
MKREIESKEESISGIARHYKTNPGKLRRAYKEHLSGYYEYKKKYYEMFEQEAFVFPENLSENMGIDETGLMDGELYTILYNKDKKGKKGSLAAIIKGTKASTVTEAIEKYTSVKSRYSIREISLDLSLGMDWIAREIAPNAIKTYDRFHVEKLITDALQQIRIKYRWEAIERENELRSKGTLRIGTYTNGDTERQLLARSRGLLFKIPEKWSEQQRQRAKVLFEEFPEIKKAYRLYMDFKMVYRMNKLRAEFHLRDWIKRAKNSGIEMFNTVANSIKNSSGGILNYLINRSTNASVENFNRKLKSFLSTLRGVNSKDLFFYRLIKLYA